MPCAADSDASLRDLMTRTGRDNMRAALIYQHKTHEADRKIAQALERLLDGHAARDHERGEKDDDDPDDGAAGVLAPAR